MAEHQGGWGAVPKNILAQCKKKWLDPRGGAVLKIFSPNGIPALGMSKNSLAEGKKKASNPLGGYPKKILPDGKKNGLTPGGGGCLRIFVRHG